MQIIFFLGQNVHDLSVQNFQKARIIELMATLTLTVWWHHEKKTIFVCSYVNFFCSFVKVLMRWVPKFFMEVAIYDSILILELFAWWLHQNKKILFVSMLISSVSLKNCCWYDCKEFIKAAIIEPIITPICIVYLHHQNKKIPVSCLFYLKNCNWHEFQRFYRSNNPRAYNWWWCLWHDGVIRLRNVFSLC